MQIVITGGAGFIGSHLAARWAEKAQVRVLDNLKTGRLENLQGIPHEWIEGDVRDRSRVEQALEGADLVFHLAAMVSVPESVERPEECFAINSQGTLNILEAARKTTCRVILASTAAVYGNSPVVPKVESMLPEPVSPYAITKLGGEHLLDYYREQFGLSCASLRFFNVFGPRQNPAGAYASAVPVFVHRALHNEPLRIFGDGSQTRDFIYVKDIVSALSFLGKQHSASGVYNAGYGKAMAILDLARLIIRKTGSSSVIEHGPKRAGDVMHSYASAEKLWELGWRPEWEFEAAIDETIQSC